MAFWWVFQGDSYKRAKEGAYLRAPQQNRTGHRLFHWTNMTQAQTGDVIFSGYQQKVVAVLHRRDHSQASTSRRLA